MEDHLINCCSPVLDFREDNARGGTLCVGEGTLRLPRKAWCAYFHPSQAFEYFDFFYILTFSFISLNNLVVFISIVFSSL